MKDERKKMKGNKTYRRLLGWVVLSIFSFQFSGSRAQELLDYPLDTVNGEEVYRYTVEKSIGLYRISVNFNVTQSEIVRLNPQLSERGLHYGETLLIPTRRVHIQESKPVVIETTVTETRVQSIISALKNAAMPPDSVSVLTDSVSAMTDEASASADSVPVVEIALMLPFESHQTKRTVNADRMMAFYQGALLAMKDMQNDSTRFRLRVYDTERSERRINALCDSSELNNVQGVIGPVYPIQIARMAEWCEAHGVAMLLPFSSGQEFTKRPRVLQFNSTDQQQADSLCRWIMARDSALQCVAVEVREADMSDAMRTLRNRMRERGITSKTLPLHDLMNDSASYVLDSAKENLILLHSDKIQHVRIILPHLAKLQAEGFHIRIVSQYSWLKEAIAIPQVYTSVFTADADREAYEKQWSTYYISEHTGDLPRYDLLGYDLTRAMIAWLQGRRESKGLQSLVRWEQTGEEGGWQNANLQIIEK